jgi:hypothetical protein
MCRGIEWVNSHFLSNFRNYFICFEIKKKHDSERVATISESAVIVSIFRNKHPRRPRNTSRSFTPVSNAVVSHSDTTAFDTGVNDDWHVVLTLQDDIYIMEIRLQIRGLLIDHRTLFHERHRRLFPSSKRNRKPRSFSVNSATLYPLFRPLHPP